MKHSLKTYRRWARMHQVDGNHRSPMLVEQAEEHDCQNCGTHYRGNFCPNCGQASNTQRFTISATMQHVVFFFAKFDSSFWHTCAELFYRPGHMIRDYINGHRVDYFRPVQMLVCLTTAYLLMAMLLQIEVIPKQITSLEQSSDVAMKGHTTMLTIMNYVEKAMNNLVFLSLAQVVVSVVPNMLLFRGTEIGKNTNMAEHFYIRVYVACQEMFVNLLFAIPALFFKSTTDTICYILVIVLLIWTYKQYFKISWWRSFWLSLFSYIISVLIILFIFFAVFIALKNLGIVY